jgi:colanic acid biosynthesis glycosyl transferase WcaI
MKILVYGLNFSPELIGIGKYTGEMAQWLAERGHEVRVVTAFPYYPQWRIDKPYGGGTYRREKLGEIKIYRCPLWVPRRPDAAWRRILHLLSFAASSAPLAIWQGAIWRPDVVIGVEPTLCAAPAALTAARLGGGCAWLHVQDLEVEAAFGVELLRGDILRRAASRAEAAMLRAFDSVSSISQRMCARVAAKGVPRERIRLVPNWVDTNEIFPLAQPSPMRRALGIAERTTVALYAGNMNEKQGLDTLVAAARALLPHQDIQFVLAGEGAARARIAAASAGLANLRLLPLQPAERLNDLLNLADIHLLPQRRGVADLVMPSKALGMMASGRPIVAGADPDTELGAVVASCGIAVPPEDATAMARAVLALARDPARRAALGAGGRRRAVAEWSKAAVLGRFEHWIAAAAGATPATEGLPHAQLPGE